MIPHFSTQKAKNGEEQTIKRTKRSQDRPFFYIFVANEKHLRGHRHPMGYDRNQALYYYMNMYFCLFHLL